MYEIQLQKCIFIHKEISSSNKATIRLRKSLSTGSWQAQGTVKTTDTGINAADGDICVVNANNKQSAVLTYTPYIQDGKWYISTATMLNGGGGPESFYMCLINVKK